MAESLRRADLRLTVSPYSPYRELAGELVDKFAEFAGVTAERKADIVEVVLQSVDASRDGRDVEIELAADGGEVSVTANPTSAPGPSK